jgi:hypothetical protein
MSSTFPVDITQACEAESLNDASLDPYRYKLSPLLSIVEIRWIPLSGGKTTLPQSRWIDCGRHQKSSDRDLPKDEGKASAEWWLIFVRPKYTSPFVLYATSTAYRAESEGDMEDWCGTFQKMTCFLHTVRKSYSVASPPESNLYSLKFEWWRKKMLTYVAEILGNHWIDWDLQYGVTWQWIICDHSCQ